MTQGSEGRTVGQVIGEVLLLTDADEVGQDAPKALDLDNPQGTMVQYNGKAMSVKL